MVESDVKHLGQIADEPPRRKPANSPPKFPLPKNPTFPIHHHDLLLHLRPTATLPLLIQPNLCQPIRGIVLQFLQYATRPILFSLSSRFLVRSRQFGQW